MCTVGVWEVHGKHMGGIWEVYKKHLGISVGAFKNACGGASDYVRGL